MSVNTVNIEVPMPEIPYYWMFVCTLITIVYLVGKAYSKTSGTFLQKVWEVGTESSTTYIVWAGLSVFWVSCFFGTIFTTTIDISAWAQKWFAWCTGQVPQHVPVTIYTSLLLFGEAIWAFFVWCMNRYLVDQITNKKKWEIQYNSDIFLCGYNLVRMLLRMFFSDTLVWTDLCISILVGVHRHFIYCKIHDTWYYQCAVCFIGAWKQLCPVNHDIVVVFILVCAYRFDIYKTALVNGSEKQYTSNIQNRTNRKVIVWRILQNKIAWITLVFGLVMLYCQFDTAFMNIFTNILGHTAQAESRDVLMLISKSSEGTIPYPRIILNNTLSIQEAPRNSHVFGPFHFDPTTASYTICAGVTAHRDDVKTTSILDPSGLFVNHYLIIPNNFTGGPRVAREIALWAQCNQVMDVHDPDVQFMFGVYRPESAQHDFINMLDNFMLDPRFYFMYVAVQWLPLGYFLVQVSEARKPIPGQDYILTTAVNGEVQGPEHLELLTATVAWTLFAVVRLCVIYFCTTYETTVAYCLVSLLIIDWSNHSKWIRALLLNFQEHRLNTNTRVEDHPSLDLARFSDQVRVLYPCATLIDDKLAFKLDGTIWVFQSYRLHLDHEMHICVCYMCLVVLGTLQLKTHYVALTCIVFCIRCIYLGCTYVKPEVKYYQIVNKLHRGVLMFDQPHCACKRRDSPECNTLQHKKTVFYQEALARV